MRATLGWLPVITATIAAAAAIVAAVVSWTGQSSVTDKDYVSLSMQILADKSSSVAAKRWAVSV